MDLLTELEHRIDAVTAFVFAAVRDVSGFADDDVVRFLALAAQLTQAGERMSAIGAGVVASRSDRASGHGGLAQSRGHRNAASLVQELSGSSRADAAKRVRLGEALLEAGTSPRVAGEPSAQEAVIAAPWHSVVDAALMDGRITTAQADAILRGLDAPPVEPGEEAATPDAVEAWRLASEQLLDEVAVRTVEDLAAAARQIRDRLDPTGAEARYLARHDARSFRMWTDEQGVRHARIRFDDHGAAWVKAMIDAALRPRRGGPRFVDPDEAAAAQHLIDDPRTNEQLAYDLVLDVLTAGATTEAEKVFGARRPGVRIVVVKDDPVGHLEDGGDAVPTIAVEQAICGSGAVEVVVDACGNPLDVGRDQRLFTPKQRLALAVRDGGCVWPGCTMPASYCEAHHIDEWKAHGGRTDIDRGVLLCRYHHMNLHHRGHRIRREGKGPLTLHPPDGPPHDLRSKSPLRWRWDPPGRAVAPARMGAVGPPGAGLSTDARCGNGAGRL
ncbi:HNH endonuclease signature motif containing protein [Microbacterium sp. JZ31]|uniref:HNH endonuclease signature motif containing protein n=1 Tax=Microbacterium sp. JZ31 TaxID=1906274 RepID=UPI001934A9B9|nr:HNH endonuclease signature motif containing protein [Microbacterium sp. JZ31]